MIVRNEALVIRETLDSVAPYVSSWVIVDTGSHDGTPDVIRDHMARRGIPGELHERPWRNFGYNRTEALALAQGHGDYIWVMDAGDTLVGAVDFGRLNADRYELRHRSADGVFWRPTLFRDRLRVRYEGVVHEYPVCDDDPLVAARLEGDYHVHPRAPDSHDRDPQQKHARDRDLLLAEVQRNPDDARSVFHLAQSYFELGDFDNARLWYARRVEMGGWDEETYCAMYRAAQSMSELGAPWPELQAAYLRAWEFRPTRAEPLHDIAQRYRLDQRYRLGYLFAQHAAEIPAPEHDVLCVRADVYAWRATDEQAVCASWIGKHDESFALCRRMLARPDIPDEDRRRIAANRDVCAPTMLAAASPYPAAPVQALQRLGAGRRNADVSVSLTAGEDLARTELTLNSFLNCCTDVSRVGRFLVLETGAAARHRGALRDSYGFLEFASRGAGDEPGAQLAELRSQIDGRFWLHLGDGWQFFAPEDLITRLSGVLEAEAQVFQVGINVADATELCGASAPEQTVRRAPEAGRYVLTQQVARGPAMFDTARLDRAGGVRGTDPDPYAELAGRAATAGLRTAALDEVLCIAQA